MKLFWFLILVGALATGGYFGYQYFNPSEESKIRKRMEELSATVSLDAQAGNIRRGLMMEKFPQFFAGDCEIKVYYQGSEKTMSGRSDMANAARYLAGMQGGIEVKFHDLSVNLDGQKKSARGALTMTMMQLSSETLTAQVFEFELKNEGGTWLIHRARSKESLTR